MAFQSNSLDSTETPLRTGSVPLIGSPMGQCTLSALLGLVTPTDVGLDQVNNTADADKPISDATQAALEELGYPDAAPTVTENTSTQYGAGTYWDDVATYKVAPITMIDSGGYHKTTVSTQWTSFEFWCDADAVELQIERSGTNVRIFVDDEPVYEITPDSYDDIFYELAFTEAKVRKFRVQGKGYGFGGVRVEGTETYTVWPHVDQEDDNKPLMLVMTDSYGNAENEVYGESYVEKLAEILGVRVYSDSLNSSGWASVGSSATTTRATNQSDLLEKPDIILACLGFNDRGSTQVDIEAGIDDWHADIIAEFPDAEIFISSSWTPQGAVSASNTVDGYISGRCTALGAEYLDLSSLVTATNEATYTGSDNTHPSQPAGHDFIAYHLATLIQPLWARKVNASETRFKKAVVLNGEELTSSAAIAWDASTNMQPTLTLAHNTTITLANLADRQSVSLSGTMGGVGSFTVALAHTGLTVREMGGALADIATLAADDLFEISIKREGDNMRVSILTLEI